MKRAKRAKQTFELLCITDSDSKGQGGERFAKVLGHYPVLSTLAKYLSIKEATRLSQALRYCSFTAHISRTLLYRHGVGRITDVPRSEWENSISSLSGDIKILIESKEVEVKDASGLGLVNPFVGKFNIARVVGQADLFDCDDNIGEECLPTLAGKLEDSTKFLLSVKSCVDVNHAFHFTGILAFSKNWKDVLEYDKEGLESLYNVIRSSLSEQFSSYMSPELHYTRPPQFVFDHEKVAREIAKALEWNLGE